MRLPTTWIHICPRLIKVSMKPYLSRIRAGGGDKPSAGGVGVLRTASKQVEAPAAITTANNG